MLTGSSNGPKLQVLDVQQAGGQVTAIGPAGPEGVFVAFILGNSIEYLNLSSKGQWTKVAQLTESVAGDFGLHVNALGDDQDTSTQVSFVEESLKTWICLGIPAPGSGTDIGAPEVRARTRLPSDVVAVCSEPHDPSAALALKSGAVRFLDLATGKAAGKGLKLEPQLAGTTAALVRLGPRRAALVRGTAPAGAAAEFFVVAFDTEVRKAQLHLQGTLSGILPNMPKGQFMGAVASEPTKSRVLLCWQPQESEADEAGGQKSATFASVVFNREQPKPVALPPLAGSPVAWSCFAGYVAEWSAKPGLPGRGGGKADGLVLTVRDARFGMQVASAEVPLPHAAAGRARPLVATAEGRTVLVSTEDGSSHIAAVQWSLPAFSLDMVVGSRVAQQPAVPGLLAPFREVVSGKRPRDDPAVDDLFRAKRHKTADGAIAEEVKSRKWAPSLELVNEVVHRKCWAAACALLSLPELDEDLAVKLLSARLELLARVVRRARAPHTLERALQDNLPASQLAGVLEVLLQWMEAYNDFPEEKLRRAAPGIPEPLEIVTFLGALADGCLSLLAHQEVNLLERLVEALIKMHQEQNKVNRLYPEVREAYRICKPPQAADHAPEVEVVLLEL